MKFKKLSIIGIIGLMTLVSCGDLPSSSGTSVPTTENSSTNEGSTSNSSNTQGSSTNGSTSNNSNSPSNSTGGIPSSSTGSSQSGSSVTGNDKLYNYTLPYVSGAISLKDAYKKSVGTEVKVRAVITAVKGNDHYIEDETGAFFVHNSSSSTYVIGDIVTITGKITSFTQAGTNQIGEAKYEKIGDTQLAEAININDISSVDNYRFGRINLNGLVVKSLDIQSGNNSFINVSCGNTDFQLIISKSLSNKTELDNACKLLIVGSTIALKGAFADYFTKMQIAITDINQVVTKELTSQEKLDNVSRTFIAPVSEGQKIRTNINLTTETTYGVKIVWESSNSTYLTNTGVVTRPEIGSNDQTVKLSYYLTYDGLETNKKEITLTIVAKSELGQDYEFSYVDPYYEGNYYTGIDDDLRGQSLLQTLDNLLDSTSHPTINFSYGMGKNGAKVFIYTDAYPKVKGTYANPVATGQLTSFYSGDGSNSGSMNCEHVWPNSRGGDFISSAPHTTRPTIKAENSARGNDFYNENGKWDPNSFGQNKYRGIAARIIFYYAVKDQEHNLKIVDKENDSFDKTDPNHRTMGKLSTLLKWNLEYDIDETEIQRNEILNQYFKHNRNPFIDDRNYACKIWGNDTAATKSVCGIK